MMRLWQRNQPVSCVLFQPAVLWKCSQNERFSRLSSDGMALKYERMNGLTSSRPRIHFREPAVVRLHLGEAAEVERVLAVLRLRIVAHAGAQELGLLQVVHHPARHRATVGSRTPVAAR